MTSRACKRYGEWIHAPLLREHDGEHGVGAGTDSVHVGGGNRPACSGEVCSAKAKKDQNISCSLNNNVTCTSIVISSTV